MENWKSKFICNNPEFQGTRKKKFVFLRSHYTSRSTLPSNGTNGLTLSIILTHGYNTMSMNTCLL